MMHCSGWLDWWLWVNSATHRRRYFGLSESFRLAHVAVVAGSRALAYNVAPLALANVPNTNGDVAGSDLMRPTGPRSSFATETAESRTVACRNILNNEDCFQVRRWAINKARSYVWSGGSLAIVLVLL